MSSLKSSVRDQVRSLLRVRKERSLMRRGPKPKIGACIFRADVRITVQAGLSDDLWTWLLDQGWRELIYRPDRRHYREIPASWVTRLIDATKEERERVMMAALSKAALKPTLSDGTALPIYINLK